MSHVNLLNVCKQSSKHTLAYKLQIRYYLNQYVDVVQIWKAFVCKDSARFLPAAKTSESIAAFLQRLMFQKKKIAIQYGIDSIDRIIGQATISAIHRFVKVLEAFYLSEGKWYTYIIYLGQG